MLASESQDPQSLADAEFRRPGVVIEEDAVESPSSSQTVYHPGGSDREEAAVSLALLEASEGMRFAPAHCILAANEQMSRYKSNVEQNLMIASCLP